MQPHAILGAIVYKFAANDGRAAHFPAVLQFPQRYLDLVRNAQGDGVLYYRAGGPQGSEYFASGTVGEILLEQVGSRLQCVIHSLEKLQRPVSYADASGLPRETAFNHYNWRSHAARVIRAIPPEDFLDILRAGELSFAQGRPMNQPDSWDIGKKGGLAERQFDAIYRGRQERVRENLRTLALDRYDGRCAFTGIRQPLHHHGDTSEFSVPRFEAQACRMVPLSCGGPDDISNILLASATFHILFDVGMIALEDDFSIICSSVVVPALKQMLNRDGKAVLPADPADWPDLECIRFHRRFIFGAQI